MVYNSWILEINILECWVKDSMDMCDLLRCPHCEKGLDNICVANDKALQYCSYCGRIYPVVDGVAIMCDDFRKNKAFETKILNEFIQNIDSSLAKKLNNEIERISNITQSSNWEWDDVEFWDKKYRDKMTRNDIMSLINNYDQWLDRLWERETLIEIVENGDVLYGDAVIVDVGCGEAQNTKLFNNQFDYYIGVDLSFNALKLAKLRTNGKFKATMFILSPADNIPIKKESVDIITCFGILHHCPKKEKTVVGLNKLLRKNGLLVLHEAYKRISFSPRFLRDGRIQSAHEDRIERNDLRHILDEMKCLFIKEGHSFFYGFMMRFFSRNILKKRAYFNALEKVDKIILWLLKAINPKLAFGDVRGVWKKRF